MYYLGTWTLRVTAQGVGLWVERGFRGFGAGGEELNSLARPKVGSGGSDPN